MKASPWKILGTIILSAVGILAVLVIIAGQRFKPIELSPSGRLVFSDNFEREEVGEVYLQGTPDPGHKTQPWRVERFCTFVPTAKDQKAEVHQFAVHAYGLESVELKVYCNRKLVAQGIHNAALWLQQPLPEKVRVEFSAVALSDEGDIKAEIFGDGMTHQSGYILIMGGWSNQMNIIARQDEHGEDRKRDARCVTRKRRRVCVEKNQVYRWAIERRADTVQWYLDDRLFMTYPDQFPINGRFFGFNNWEARVAFDDLRVFALD